eukprot:6268181-Karenia_brevis.AAC.1
MKVAEITGLELSSLLCRISRSGSRGADGWGVDELKQLPVHVFSLLAEFLNTCESYGSWPNDLERGLVTMIGKED